MSLTAQAVLSNIYMFSSAYESLGRLNVSRDIHFKLKVYHPNMVHCRTKNQFARNKQAERGIG